MRLLVAVAILTMGLMLSACGDDDNGDVADTVEETTTTDETTAAEEALVGTGKIVEIAADPTGDLAYQQENITAESGKVQIKFTNEAEVRHNVVVENDAGEALGRTDVITDAKAEALITLTSGTYTFYCSVDGHREAGMEGTLVIK